MGGVRSLSSAGPSVPLVVEVAGSGAKAAGNTSEVIQVPSWNPVLSFQPTLASLGEGGGEGGRGGNRRSTAPLLASGNLEWISAQALINSASVD